MKRVAIIGAGAMGQALAHILKKKENASVLLYDKNPARVAHAALPLAKVVAAAECVFMCVPSWAMREALLSLRLHLANGAIVVSLAKGVEPERKQTMDALLSELLPRNHTAILGGPMLAAEFMDNLPGVGCLAASRGETLALVAALFKGTLLSLETNRDVRGVALAGVLKNIYALGLGIARALSWGDNQKGWYVSTALREMADITELLGGKRETAFSLAGLGDLVATGWSKYSRNGRFGEEIVKNGVCSIQSEGCASLPLMRELLAPREKSFKLFNALTAVIIDKADAKSTLEKLIKAQS